MDEDILVIVAAAVTTLSGIGALLTAWWLWLRNKAQRSLAPEDVAHLKRAVEDLRLDVDALQRELTDSQQELHERLDFAERLLAQKRDEPPPLLEDRH